MGNVGEIAGNLGIVAERTSTGISEWAGNSGVRPGIRVIGEEEIRRDGLRSWQWEEGGRGCKPRADGGGREVGGENSWMAEGRSRWGGEVRGVCR